MKTLRLVSCFVVGTCALAADIVLNDGSTLKNGRIVSVGNDQVVIVHSGGVSNYGVDEVPLDLVARAKMEQDAKRSDPERRAQEELYAFRSAEKDQKERTQAERDRIARAKRELDRQAYEVHATVFQVVPGLGFLVSGSDAYRYIQATETRRAIVQETGLNAHLKKVVTWDEVVTQKVPAGLGDMCFVRSATAGIVDGQRLYLRLWRIGEYHYTSVQSAGKTVARYTRDPAEYLDFISPIATAPAPAVKPSKLKF